MAIDVFGALKSAAKFVANPVGSIVELVVNTASTIGSNKIDDVVNALQGNAATPELKASVLKLTQDHERAQDSAWQNWNLAREGRAEDMPVFVQIMRASIRPFLSITIPGLWAWCTVYQMNNITLLPVEKLALLAQLNNKLALATVMVLGFWFGEKLLTRTGLVDAFKNRGKG